MFSLFTPKWKKQSKLVLKGSQKFVNYRRDLLQEEQVTAIEESMHALKQASRASDKAAAETEVKKLTELCNFSKGMSKAEASLMENTEVIFVSIAIALALRAYVVQPFRIPTGSMQPTLNGSRGYQVPLEDWPSAPKRWFEAVANGRIYNEFTLEQDDTLIGVTEKASVFVTNTTLHFAKAGKVRVSGSASAVIRDLGIAENLSELFDPAQIPGTAPSQAKQARAAEFLRQYLDPKYSESARLGKLRIPVPAGTRVFSGYTQSGDLILVDKFSYHFRRPERGEVFVFDTRDIEGTAGSSKAGETMLRLGRQAGGQHYIKRLAGLPGDRLEIRESEVPGSSGTLFVNGEQAQGEGFDRVHAAEGEYHGYDPNLNPEGVNRLALGETAELKRAENPMFDEYLPLGDNSQSSLDGRYWKIHGQYESVHGYNLVGPAWFSLWPITVHWGIIK